MMLLFCAIFNRMYRDQCLQSILSFNSICKRKVFTKELRDENVHYFFEVLIKAYIIYKFKKELL